MTNMVPDPDDQTGKEHEVIRLTLISHLFKPIFVP